jgi:hypothetical protein
MSRIFISHAGSESHIAVEIADLLKKQGIDVSVDREELVLGDSFIAFMEHELATSDYCLLLWSCTAARQKWVRIEWEAALYRSVQKQRGFLVVGRLEDHPVPVLLGPRLMVDLFPQYQPGLERLINLWNTDRAAEQVSERAVASASLGSAPRTTERSTNVYITSNQFDITVPFKVDLADPAGILLDEIKLRFKLPKVFDHEGLIGVRFSYQLTLGEVPLGRGLTLGNQGVKEHSIIWLETIMTPFSSNQPDKGALVSAVFRANVENPRLRNAREMAKRYFNERLEAANLIL